MTSPQAPSSGSSAPDGDLPEVSGLPAGAPATGQWRRVPRAPEEVTDTTPVEDAGVPDPPPPIPLPVKVVGIALIALLLLAAVWVGMSLGRSAPVEAPSFSPPPPPAWAMEPPQVLGEFVQGTLERNPAGSAIGKEIVRADYSDGTDRVVLLLSRPETSLEQYLAEAGVEGATEVGQSSCGTSIDTNRPVCARIADDTAIMVAGLTEQALSTLAGQVDEFYGAMAP